MNNIVFDNIIRLANKKGVFRKKDIAELIGANSQKLTNWKNRGVPPSVHKQVADSLGVTVDELLRHPMDKPNTIRYSSKSIRTIPIISKVQAGTWMENTNPYEIGDNEGTIETTENVSNMSYALKISGDSMTPTIPEGSIIIVDPLRQAENGQIVVIRQNGDSEATVKRLVIDGSKKYLKPDNERYPLLEMLEDANICGVAVAFHRSLL
jgi:SOS-response transcriptional repressor LexA